mgnify:CR=1 FL=1
MYLNELRADTVESHVGFCLVLLIGDRRLEARGGKQWAKNHVGQKHEAHFDNIPRSNRSRAVHASCVNFKKQMLEFGIDVNELVNKKAEEFGGETTQTLLKLMFGDKV